VLLAVEAHCIFICREAGLEWLGVKPNMLPATQLHYNQNLLLLLLLLFCRF
jgi:hypothetical protein